MVETLSQKYTTPGVKCQSKNAGNSKSARSFPQADGILSRLFHKGAAYLIGGKILLPSFSADVQIKRGGFQGKDPRNFPDTLLQGDFQGFSALPPQNSVFFGERIPPGRKARLQQHAAFPLGAQGQAAEEKLFFNDFQHYVKTHGAHLTSLPRRIHTPPQKHTPHK